MWPWRKREPKCGHHWLRIGYGGCGWTLYRCAFCGEKEIG